MKDINLFRTGDSIYLKRVKSKLEVSKDDDCDGYLIESSEKEARRIIDSLKKSGKLIGLVGGDDAFNRRAVETLKIDYLVCIEGKTGRGTLKQRDSGINHFVAKLAREKGIKIVIGFSDLTGLEKKEKSLRIGKLIQNVKICRKAKCDLKIASLGAKKSFDEKMRMAFGQSVGMSSVQVKNCVEFD